MLKSVINTKFGSHLARFVGMPQSVHTPDPFRYFTERDAAIVVDRRDGRVLQWRGKNWQADGRKSTYVYECGTIMTAEEFSKRYGRASKALLKLV